MKKILFYLLGIYLSANTLNAQETVIQVEAEKTVLQEQGRVLKRKVAIGRFSNETQYAKGIFYEKSNDPMAKQALDILSSKLAVSDKFLLLERNDLDKIQEESNLNNTELQKVGADYLILGSITEFGRKNIGDQRVFSSTKTQIVEAAVNIRLVDVKTGLIIYSEEAKGTAELKSKEVLGIGGVADFDATLSDKAISAAISKLVENIINKCTDKPWRAYFLAADENGIIISGGASQGIRAGDTFAVKQKGKTVKNPQTGIKFELPGKTVGKIIVNTVAGEIPENEFSIVSITEGELNFAEMNEYYIEEIKL